nr:MAG TPA: IGLE PROTEIN, BACTERIAL SECRETION SYSTEM [Caudoviricetes sp.]
MYCPYFLLPFECVIIRKFKMWNWKYIISMT